MTQHATPAVPAAGAAAAPTCLPKVVKAVRTSARPVPAEIQLQALRTTARFVELARRLYGKAFPMPTVAFDLRGKTAGQAFFNQNLIRYNAVLLMENAAEFDAQTIPHEVAHLIARQHFGPRIDSHGAEWQQVMRDFGVAPRRCHSYDVSNSAVGGVHQYTCDCQRVYPLSARRNKAARAGLLSCRTCRARLRPVGGAPVVRPTPATAAPRRPAAPPRVAPPPAAPAALPRLGATPATRPGPSAPAGSPRPATPAMLQYALTIAHKLGIALLPEHVGSFEACADFIHRFKGASPAARAPSDKQLQYARDIARRKGLVLDAATLADAGKLSAWLTAHR